MKSHDIRFVFTAAYSRVAKESPARPEYDRDGAKAFFDTHGFAARAIGVTVDDATEAYNVSTQNGAVGVLAPLTLTNEAGETSIVSEIKMFGDTVLRFVQLNGFVGPHLPNYEAIDGPEVTYGLKYLDHIVSNVHELVPAAAYLCKSLGLHEFAEFVAEDVGTVDSGLNSMVLANNSEHVLLPINEPTFGTRRKSQIQTYLEQVMSFYNYICYPNFL
jgi:4-hydroxyphenylpyruvate dioxygenase